MPIKRQHVLDAATFGYAHLNVLQSQSLVGNVLRSVAPVDQRVVHEFECAVKLALSGQFCAPDIDLSTWSVDTHTLRFPLCAFKHKQRMMSHLLF